jgi:secreted PhoX family phosphatase
MSRKEFLAAGATAGAGAALSGLVARNAMAVPSKSRGNAGKGEGGYGELSPQQAENDPGTYLAVPAGFSYAIFGVEGSEMSDGNPTPKGHDGMAAFQLPNGNVRLIRNHEDRDNPLNSTVKGDPSTAYDSKGGGGTTSLEVRPTGDRDLVRDFQSLNGTIVNCAGGPTPWDTWMTCEETTAGQTQGWNKDHGYIYEVPVSATDEVQAVPNKAMGRFVHEAAAVDPQTGYVYMTEDRGTAGLYRFIPDSARDLSAGRVQMLKVKGRSNYNTTSGQQVDKPLPVEWVDIEDPDPAEAETNPLAVFQQGQDNGGAIFSRLEGCWYGDGSIFFHATDGGDAELGQVWEYRPRGRSGGQLILLFESKSPEMLDAPDNVTVSPRGGLAICEDGSNGNYVRGLTEDGKIFDFVHNVTNDREFAGATFSPDGETLFVNIQGDLTVGGSDNKGMTFTIWGPWEDGAL